MTKKYVYTCVDCDLVWEGNRPQRGVRCKPHAMTHSNISRKDVTKTTCEKCGNPKSYQAKYCRGCRDQMGENNPMYGKPQPHLTEYNLSRTSDEHWNWKGGIPRKRDGQSQQWGVNVRKVGVCGTCSSTEMLEAHHLESHDINKELRWETSNGVCLCKNCHLTFHKMYGFGDNTTEQYLEFKEKYNGSN